MILALLLQGIFSYKLSMVPEILSRRALFWRLAQNLTFVASAYSIVGSFQQQLGFRDKKCLNDQHYKRVISKTIHNFF